MHLLLHVDQNKQLRRKIMYFSSCFRQANILVYFQRCYTTQGGFFRIANIFPFKNTADPSNICYLINYSTSPTSESPMEKPKSNIRPSRLKYYSTNADLNSFHINCECFGNFWGSQWYWKVVDKEIDFGKRKKWQLFFILMTSHWTSHRSGQKAWNSCLWDDPQKVKPSLHTALHSLLFSLYCSLKISLVLSLKQYRPYVLNLAFGLELISACRRGSPTDKIFQNGAQPRGLEAAPNRVLNLELLVLKLGPSSWSSKSWSSES